MKDFLSEVGYAALTSRLKRLGDALLYSTKDFYKEVGADIEPSWPLVLSLLKTHRALSLTEIAEYFQYSHPSIIKMVNNMKAKGYVQTEQDPTDSRKQIITLTEKAHQTLPLLETYWEACVLTVQELLEDTPEFLDALSKVEAKVQAGSYKERTLKNLKLLSNTSRD